LLPLLPSTCMQHASPPIVGGGVGRFVLVRKGRVGRGEGWRSSRTIETACRTQGRTGCGSAEDYNNAIQQHRVC
jgi:hypothetical protein